MKNHNFLQSFKNALAGLHYGLRHERNFRFHCLAVVAVIALSLYLRISSMEFVALCISIAFVLFSEMINTAIEKAYDLIGLEINPTTKAAKDCAAAGVLIAAINAVIVGVVIFGKYLIMVQN